MRYSKEHQEKTKLSILNAALLKFRTEGYNGIGVDGISKEAGVTSGAFYKHFESKSEAFRNVVSEGLSALRMGLVINQQIHGRNWLNTFMKWYFSFPDSEVEAGERRPLPMEGGCALTTLSPEVARTDPETQHIFEQELGQIADVLAAGLPKGLVRKRKVSWAVLSLMVGGVVLARSVNDDKTAQDISTSVLAAIRKITQQP
ncbi:MAG: TetR/AcrR family transcriptional regulator [Oleispira sp.]|nr:TetR/AcrR family transcriptional regulator [Oleispira sp.]